MVAKNEMNKPATFDHCECTRNATIFRLMLTIQRCYVTLLQ